MLAKFLDLLGAEPVIVIGSITGIIDTTFALVVGFGLHLPPTAAGLTDAFVAAALGFVALLYIRSRVSPAAPAAPAAK